MNNINTHFLHLLDLIGDAFDVVYVSWKEKQQEEEEILNYCLFMQLLEAIAGANC